MNVPRSASSVRKHRVNAKAPISASATACSGDDIGAHSLGFPGQSRPARPVVNARQAGPLASSLITCSVDPGIKPALPPAPRTADLLAAGAITPGVHPFEGAPVDAKERAHLFGGEQVIRIVTSCQQRP